MDTWIECAWFQCRKRFEPGRRANQHRHAGGEHHQGALYCSRACQQKAYRLRRNGGSATVTRALVDASKTTEGTNTHATVTPAKRTERFQGVVSVKNGHARPSKRPLSTRAGKIVPDAKWPGMYRIKWRGGALSDMVNYTRAADALREAS
jgi:hypothetical protein